MKQLTQSILLGPPNVDGQLLDTQSFAKPASSSFPNFSQHSESVWMDSIKGLPALEFKEDADSIRVVIPCDLSVCVHQLMAVARYCPGIQI